MADSPACQSSGSRHGVDREVTRRLAGAAGADGVRLRVRAGSLELANGQPLAAEAQCLGGRYR